MNANARSTEEAANRATTEKLQNTEPTGGVLASLGTYFGALGRRRPKEPLGPRALVDESVELITLLIARGVDLTAIDVSTVLKAARDFDKEEWTPEQAAAVAICHAKLANAAKPATLASLRHARSGRRRLHDYLLIGFTILGLLLIFVLQFQSVQISDATVRAEELLLVEDLRDTAQNEQQIANAEVKAQIDRLKKIPLLRYFVSLPQQNEGASQRVILAEARSWANALNTLILPALYGMLGSIAFILRNHPMNVRNALLTGDVTGEYFIRMVLGLVSGITIGLFDDNVSATSATGEGASPGAFATVTPVALAFLAGYAVDLLFGIMDRIVAPFTSETSSPEGVRRTSS